MYFAYCNKISNMCVIQFSHARKDSFACNSDSKELTLRNKNTKELTSWDTRFICAKEKGCVKLDSSV